MAATDIVTLDDAKQQLNMTATGTEVDAELGGYVSAASRVVDRHVGPVIQRTVTEVFDGGRPNVLLSQIPVASVTSVTDNGTALAAGDYTVNGDSGELSRIAGQARTVFLPGVQSVQVVYVAGRAATPAAVAEAWGDYRLAVLIIVQHMWETQRPAAAGPFSQSSDDYDPRYSYSIPRRALELLGEPIGGIA